MNQFAFSILTEFSHNSQVKRKEIKPSATQKTRQNRTRMKKKIFFRKKNLHMVQRFLYTDIHIFLENLQLFNKENLKTSILRHGRTINWNRHRNKACFLKYKQKTTSTSIILSRNRYSKHSHNKLNSRFRDYSTQVVWEPVKL